MKWTVFVLGVVVAALAGCVDDVDDPTASPFPVESSSSHLVDGEEEIVIKTHVDLLSVVDTGEVLEGSFLGDSAFCPGGTHSGGHGNTDNGWLDKTFECSDGTLTLVFDPRNTRKRSASGPWEVLRGTGTYEGLEGSGEMIIWFSAATQNAPVGKETFSGTVSQ